jgi:hypothetical protein
MDRLVDLMTGRKAVGGDHRVLTKDSKEKQSAIGSWQSKKVRK